MPFLQISNLTIDEYEAIRLADFENKKHEEAAGLMSISRPTFSRLLESAHAKISDAIVNGKAIKIEGGDFRFIGSRFECRKCGNSWNMPQPVQDSPACPKCNGREINDIGNALDRNIAPGRGHRGMHGRIFRNGKLSPDKEIKE